MALLRIVLFTLLTVLLVSCVTQNPYVPSETVEKTRAEYDALTGKMTRSVSYVGAPLKGLNQEQLASVAALVVMARAATQNEGMRGLSNTSFSNAFWAEVIEICPPMPKDLGAKLPGCLGTELAYGESMASCMESKCKKFESDTENCDELKWKYESVCERENGGKLGAAVQCRMDEIAKMQGIIQRIPGRRWPPRPIPWPE